MPRFDDLLGTSIGFFQLAIRGVRLKNVGGNLAVRNPGDTQDAELTTLKLNNTSNVISIGSTNPLTLQRNPGQTGNLAILFPTAKSAVDGYALTQKAGTGVGVIELELTPLPATGTKQTVLNYNSPAQVPMFDLPANASLRRIIVYVETGWNAESTIQIGTASAPAKYLSITQVDLTQGGTQFGSYPSIAAATSSESLIVTYAANGATAGKATIEAYYNTTLV